MTALIATPGFDVVGGLGEVSCEPFREVAAVGARHPSWTSMGLGTATPTREHSPTILQRGRRFPKRATCRWRSTRSRGSGHGC